MEKSSWRNGNVLDCDIVIVNNIQMYSLMLRYDQAQIWKFRLSAATTASSQILFNKTLFSNLFYHIYPTPPLGQDMTQGHFFKQSLTGLNSEFSFS